MDDNDGTVRGRVYALDREENLKTTATALALRDNGGSASLAWPAMVELDKDAAQVQGRAGGRRGARRGAPP